MSTKTPNDTQSQSVEDDSSTDVGVDGDGSDDGVGPALGPDRIFEVLKNQRRRRTLQYLVERDNPVTIGALAEHIAALENDTTESALTSRERKRVYVGLYQCHLPKMDDTGAVEFNKARGTISLGPTFQQFEPYLNLDGDDADAWAHYYLLLTGASGVIFGANTLFAGISSAQLFTGVLVGFVVLSIMHLYKTTEHHPLSGFIDR
ncbi:DUF7344 domain-containing protein [Halocatena pleomorpha]|uniref:DUF7344 domain-containing protein n=1 Tax=Halocatena pleomorpha TaxID=1785090 RepID=A0A3P3RMN4_9EURY|nr:hypothetical protein [Halocatena pleomorpha]RRJ33653.1 hypothetical protein EIK79_02320 [Halocatena pleomorpha]